MTEISARHSIPISQNALPLCSLPPPSLFTPQLAWAPAALGPQCATILACCGDDGQLSFWDTTDPSEAVGRWKLEASFIYGLRWAAEPPCLASVTDNGKCIVHRCNLRNIGSGGLMKQPIDWCLHADALGAAVWSVRRAGDPAGGPGQPRSKFLSPMPGRACQEIDPGESPREGLTRFSSSRPCSSSPMQVDIITTHGTPLVCYGGLNGIVYVRAHRT